MSINEQALWLHGEGFDMLGIVSLPPTTTPMQSTGVVIVVGGAQYRVGSHRQFVQLARFLAQAGFPVLRFDFPGMGDSPGDMPSFEHTAPHIATAINGFQRQHPGVERVVLWGLCDGASASLLYVDATHDPRIAGLALLNPWVRSEVSLARARVKHYYWQRMREPEFWSRLLRGQVGWGALKSLGSNLRIARSRTGTPKSFQERMARGWASFQHPVLLMLSELDLTAQEFNIQLSSSAEWLNSPNSEGRQQILIKGADHTCSGREATLKSMRACLQWLTSAPLKGDIKSPFNISTDQAGR